MSSAVSPEPIRYAPYVSRLIPGTASRRSDRKSNRSIGTIETTDSAFPGRETAPELRLRDLFLPSPMRTAGEGWMLFWAVASDYLAIFPSWAAVCVVSGIATQPGWSWMNWRMLSRALLHSGNFRLGLIFAVTTTLLAYSEGLYRSTEQTQKQARVLLKSAAWSSGAVWCTAGGMGSWVGNSVFVGSVILSMASLFAVRRIRSKQKRSGQRNTRNVLIVGAGTTGRSVAAYLGEHPETGRSFRGFLDYGGGFGVLGSPQELGRIARAEFVDEVILAVSDRRDLGQSAMQEALRNHLDVKIVPDLFGAKIEDSFLESWGKTPLLTLHRERLPVTRLFLKRALDIVISTFALAAAAAIMMVIAALIRLDSRGPVLYTALRVGRKGRRFRCFKFRTMTAGSDQQRESLREKNQRDGPCFKMAEDPRVTRVGRWLRRYSLDELPQLWNVLRGEMSLVGPRPHPLDDVARYELNHLRRLDVTPGLTGLWQISARQSGSFQTNLALDLEYIHRWSLWMDLRILVKTLFGRSARNGSVVDTNGFHALSFEASQRGRIAPESGHSPLAATVFAPLLALVVCPVPVFLIALTFMLFRPPEIEFYSVDRIAFAVLVGGVLLRTVVRRQQLAVYGITLPMCGLSVMAAVSAMLHPFEAKIWSVTAAKFIVPFVLFHLAGLIFEDKGDLRWLERFSLAVLAYLVFTALAFWVGAHQLVFPRFILDQNLGIHTERARGPFLQAVANGVTLNLLGLLAIDRYRAGRMSRGWAILLLSSLPLAILATKTRGVWLSFAISAGWLVFGGGESRRARGLRWLLVVLGGGVLVAMLNGMPDGLEERLQDSSPVEFRMAAYRAGWSMFLERPLSGWGASQLQSELAQRIDGFQGESFAVHNTYLEILLEHGVFGFALYLWVVIELMRLGRIRGATHAHGFTASLQSLWPLLVGVYLVNATFVVMNYQFVNGLFFAFAGILAAQQKRSNEMEVVDAAAC